LLRMTDKKRSLLAGRDSGYFFDIKERDPLQVSDASDDKNGDKKNESINAC
jgi:hypothetical protein